MTDPLINEMIIAVRAAQAAGLQAVMIDPDHALELCERANKAEALRELGIRLGMDDYVQTGDDYWSLDNVHKHIVWCEGREAAQAEARARTDERTNIAERMRLDGERDGSPELVSYAGYLATRSTNAPSATKPAPAREPAPGMTGREAAALLRSIPSTWPLPAPEPEHTGTCATYGKRGSHPCQACPELEPASPAPAPGRLGVGICCRGKTPDECKIGISTGETVITIPAVAFVDALNSSDWWEVREL